MRLGIDLGYWGVEVARDGRLVAEAERLGYHSVWTAEAYGSDAVTPLAYLAACTERIHLGAGIMQIPARTPAATAMTAATLDLLSGGRFILGLGVSGPQVVEGWHGVAYGRPLRRTREFVTIVRRILAREEPVTHDGDEYTLPYRGPEATGLGKALRLIAPPLRPDLPIYLAAIGPRNVRLAAEIADGWLPVFFSPMRAPKLFRPLLEEGFTRCGDPTKQQRFDVAPSVFALVTEDLQGAYLQVKPVVALYVGGMGAKGRNFYHDLACRYGFEEAAQRIQDLYLGGHKEEAALAVPDELVDEVSLIGPRERIAERLDVWRAAGVTTLRVSTMDLPTLRTLAELV